MPRPKATRKKNGKGTSERDSLDFRDWIYRPSLTALPEQLLPERSWMFVDDQGTDGACTGFGLAAMINYLIRDRGGSAREKVSPRMLYEMAKRHDRWPGQSYDGSSARGAMKGWAKNGVCLTSYWPYESDDPGEFDEEASLNALDYPLGAYYRVLPKRSDVHAALNETGVVFATAATHRGWDGLKKGAIPYEPRWSEQGGHAFAIVGYTNEGFLIQNSWGKGWGRVTIDRKRFAGCAIWSYADFDRNVWDIWVAHLARPYESVEALVHGASKRSEKAAGKPPQRRAPPRQAIRDHFVHIDDGHFDPYGDYWSTEGEARRIVKQAVTGGSKHLVLYAHGGLNSVKASAERAAAWKDAFSRNGVAAIHLIWETGLLEELRDVLLGKQDFVSERAGGLTDWTDRWIERATGALGRGVWHEMISDAAIAFEEDLAGTRLLQMIVTELDALPPARRPKLHLVGHSAGSILFGNLLSRWRTLDGAAAHRFENLVLFAPACTHAFFGDHILPALADRTVGRLHHFLLDDEAEKDDNVGLVYRKSLLYLVSRAYQRRGDEVPLLGMQRYLEDLDTGTATARIKHHSTGEQPALTTSTSHGGFDNDLPTMNAMLGLVLGKAPRRPFKQAEMEF